MPRRPIAAVVLTLFMTVAALCVRAIAADAPATRPALPPAEPQAKAALNASPRHGEYVDVDTVAGQPPVRCWVVYPEIKDKAPVVIVIQEIFGLTDWLRATADTLAGEGFITITPDLLSGRSPSGPVATGGGTDSFPDRDSVTKAVRDLKPDAVNAMLDAVSAYARHIPASSTKTATLGFCWGGGASFAYAVHDPALSAAVVCYGTPPRSKAEYAQVHCPVAGFYGGDDARVTSTVPAAEAGMKEAGKTYTPHVYPGAGHGFFRQQDGKNGANFQAAQGGWPAIVVFLRANTR